MGITLSVIIFIIGIILVIKGGDFFVDAASWIAKAAGIPSFIIGATIVSIATTMPEMIVSCLASAEGKNEMAIGNAVGSVIANTGLIMAIALIFLAVKIIRKEYIAQCTLLILSIVALYFGSLQGYLAPWASVVLFVIFVAFMVLNLINGKKQANPTEEEIDKSKASIIKNVVMFVGGAVALVIGSRLLVNGGSNIATALGVPERIIAVTLVAIGTSLPELVTTLTAIKKKEASLSIGNIVGANLIDLTLILPICSFISSGKLPFTTHNTMVDIPASLAISLIALIPILIREKSAKLQGVIMLIAYGGYLYLTMA